MTVHVFHSTDGGAPALPNTAGALIAVLDALLVNGYNSKTVTITQLGGVATATCAAHGFNVMQTLAIAGANEPEYNLTVRIASVPNTNTFTFPVDPAAVSPATGGITAKVAPIGWTKAFAATNLASYRTKVGTNQFYMAIDDSSLVDARVRGFVTMTAAGPAVANGTEPFPTDAQLSGGGYLYKGGSQRVWKAFSNGRYLHFLFDGTNNPTLPAVNRIGFGDFTSKKAGDAYNTALEASSASSDTSVPGAFNCTSVGSYTAGFYMARGHNQLTASMQAARVSDSPISNSSRMGNGPINYPAPISGGLLMCRMLIGEYVSYTDIRGVIPGLWNPLHGRPLVQGDTFSGVSGSSLAGRTFEYVEVQYSNSVSAIFETSDTWE